MRDYNLDDLVVGKILEEKATTHRSQTFLKFHHGEFTYGEVNAEADRLARGLDGLGIRKHDHVAVMLHNCPEFVFITFALSKIGAVAVMINTEYKGELLQHVLETADVTCVIIDEAFVDALGSVATNLPALRSIIVRSTSSRLPLLNGVNAPVSNLHNLFKTGGRSPAADVKHSDTHAIMFTSGTTGVSKGVICPNAHVMTCAIDSLWVQGYDENSTMYCPLPLFHAAALWDGMFSAMLAGTPIAITERFSASRFWEDVRWSGATSAMGIFSMIPILMKAQPSPTDRDHTLKTFYLGQSSMDAEFFERFGAHAVESYTSTEVGVGTASPWGSWIAGSCGQPNERNFNVRVVDGLDNEVSPGVPGEIVVRPRRPYVMTTGYYGFWKFNSEIFRNCWFHTGDRAYRNEDGYFFFVERIKDSIRRRGENISAFELERAINSHESVLESAAFGVPSEIAEDEVKVSVVLRTGSELTHHELLAFCRERLPSFMTPRYIEFVGELPKTAIGKIAKQELRAQGDSGITSSTWDSASLNARMGRRS
jgi:carnitine-CoA ligase